MSTEKLLMPVGIGVADQSGQTFPAFLYLVWAHSHMIHYRGQLSAYLRPMGAKVPSIYGASADAR